MRTRKLLFCILAIAIVSGVALFIFLLLPHRQEDLPVPWDLGELNKEMPLHWEAGPLNVLVWEVIDDGQRVYERCLAVKRYDRPTDEGETCALGYLLRLDEGGKKEWRAHWIMGRLDHQFNLLPPLFGYKLYQSLPTDPEIAAFLEEESWGDAFLPGTALNEELTVYHPKLLRGGVCQTTWKKVFSREPPAGLFPELARAAD